MTPTPFRLLVDRIFSHVAAPLLRRAWALWPPVLAALSLQLVAGPALAQTAAERTTARTLAREGQQALIDGDFDTSADRFERASALVDAPTLLLGLARARVGQGRLVEAYELYQRITRKGASDDAPAAFKRAVEAANAEIEELEGRLAWITITTTGLQDDAQANVTINGTQISNASIGVRRPVDPGSVIVRAEAPGYEAAEMSFEVTEGERDAVAALELVKLKETAAQHPAGTTGTGQLLGADADSGSTSLRTTSYVVMGIGAAGLVAGGVTGLLALDKSKFLEDKCVLDPPQKCPKSVESDVDSYDTLKTATLVGLIGGGALAAGGLAMYFLFPPPDDGEAAIRPYLSPTSAGMVGTF